MREWPEAVLSEPHPQLGPQHQALNSSLAHLSEHTAK